MSVLEPGLPCNRCGVRPDVGCRHRPAEGQPRVQEVPKVDGRTLNTDGRGFAFRIAAARKNHHSLFGKAGNPTKSEFEAMMKKRGG